MNKKVVFLVSLIGVLALIFIRYSDFVNSDGVNYRFVELLHNVLLFFPITFLFSLATYRLPPLVFTSWWKFARIAIPAILIISTIINLRLHHTSHGFFSMDNMFDIPALITLYAVFVLGSIVQVYRGYRR